MRRLKALRTFRVSDTNKVVHTGQEFESALGEAYEKRGYAVFADGAPRSVAANTRNRAADAGPLRSVGGETGERTFVSSSPEDQAPRKRRSRQSKGEQDF
jgi:hypothetical protein